MTAKIKVPRIRFGEFGDEWKERKLWEIAKIYDWTHQTPKYVEKWVKFVSVEDINNIENTKKFITNEAYNKFKIKPQKNDILMTRITAWIIGATSIVKNDNPLWYYVSLALIRIILQEKYSVNFVEKYINSNYFKHELFKRIIHVAFPKKINLWDINDCTINLPSLPEQQKLASFLSSVDEKIENIKEKKEKLEEYKKWVMQKIFKQEVRFKGENWEEFEDWEERRLGEVCNITTWKLDANAMIKNWKYRFYTCAKEYFQIDKYAFNTEALLISWNWANVWYIHYYKWRFNAYQRTYILDWFQENIIFIKYFLEKNLSRRILAEKNEWNTPYIVLWTLSKMTIKLPSLLEQEKIADFLSSIDEKIVKVSEELEKMDEFKNGLLQGMFV